jgi:hypothetical protein
MLRMAIDLKALDGPQASRPVTGSQAARSNPPREGAPGSFASADPVTITVTFNVKPGRELDFERWAHDITVAGA